MLAASMMAMYATGAAGCLTSTDSEALTPIALPAWAEDKAAYQEEWSLAGHQDLASVCADGQASPPRIVGMVVARHLTGVNSGYVALLGCDADGVNYHGLIAGTVEVDPARPNAVVVAGYGTVRTKLADGAIAQKEDRNAAFTVEFEETMLACDGQRSNGMYYVESATRSIGLRAPASDYKTAGMLQGVVRSELNGTRKVLACD